MGCASSKRVEATVDAYRPPPSSFAVFDITTVEEPWRTADFTETEQEEKPTNVPSPIFEKLNSLDDTTRTWDEVSKDLEVLKPTLQLQSPPPKPVPVSLNSTPTQESPFPMKKVKRRSFSFHTLEELDTKTPTKPKSSGLKKSESMSEMNRFQIKPQPKKVNELSRVESEGYKPVKENMFLVRDKLEREKEGKPPTWNKRNPLSDYPEKCPPGGADSVVLYTTSLGGVRKTKEDCDRVRSILEVHGFVFQERDVSLHGEFLNELKVLVGEGVSVPRMFVKGRYLGGVDEVVGMNEMGKLRRMMNWVGVERRVGRQACEGCGGKRFVPCLDCGGSCKVVVGDTKERCPECNENGLVHCPICS